MARLQDADDELFISKDAMAPLSKGRSRVFFAVQGVKDMEDGTRRVRFALDGEHDQLGLEPAASILAVADDAKGESTPHATARQSHIAHVPPLSRRRRHDRGPAGPDLGPIGQGLL